jgi:hypothetical protein
MGITSSGPTCSAFQGPPNPRVNGKGTHTDFRKPGIPHLRAAGGRIA